MNNDLERKLEKVKAKMFIGSNGAFYGSLVCTSDIKFSDEIPTACTDGITIKLNPKFFEESSENFRLFVLAHELRHIALLHEPRRNNRHTKKWNIACDYVINEQLVKEGYIYDNQPLLLNSNYYDLSEEEIYEILDEDVLDEEDSLGEDLKEGNQASKQQVVNTVVSAIQIASMGQGEAPMGIKTLLDSFLKPVVPWERYLEKLLTEYKEEIRTWSRPNRRYEDMYLPSTTTEEDRLTKLNFYIDVSGSIDDTQLIRFISEVKYIKETFNPEELNIIQFDTVIQHELCIKDSDTLSSFNVIGRGGTCLECVKEHINNNKPTAAIIFSDLACQPMKKPVHKSEIIWLVYGSDYRPSFGTFIKVV